MKIKPLQAIDFYKGDHRPQYPEGTTLVYSNFTPRSNKLSNLPHSNDFITFFGLQYFIKHYLLELFNESFFSRPKEEVVAEYKKRMDTSLGKDAISVEHIAALHDLGYLPLEIRALPEGSLVPMRVPCLTIHNTHPDFFWLVNYIESVLSCNLWKMCTTATTAHWYKKLVTKYADLTGSPKDILPFQCHDFSFRGMSGMYDAAASGAGHLLSFMGTDTVLAIDFLEQYYNADCTKELIGASVPATEHSVMCMGGKENEIDTFKRLITRLYPAGIVSIVSDTWDFWKVVTEYASTLHQEIMSREGKVVFRPDSGDPVKIICGTAYKLSDSVFMDVPHLEKIIKAGFDAIEHKGRYYKIGPAIPLFEGDIPYEVTEVNPTPEMKGAVQCLWEIFGGTTTEKGFKLLDNHVGLIYGDSITPERAEAILNGLKIKGFASVNVVFGVGSFTYQYTTRDTYGFAVKATYGVVNGQSREIFKDPITDDGIKKSAKGLLLVKDGVLYDQQDRDTILFPNDGTSGDMLVVFKDGELRKEYTLSEIRSKL